MQSLENTWIDDLKQNLNNALIILVGNKSDIWEDKRQVLHEEGVSFAKKHGLDFFLETSAKSGSNMTKIAQYIAKELYLRNRKTLADLGDESETSSVHSREDHDIDGFDRPRIKKKKNKINLGGGTTGESSS